ncbi:hypothetical protein DPMN_102322 [Dreissena polymorpha]|uniref:Uncharacterized protein n=1 Tax=Dreissena polymorpha TaxID=45954 RepID=A0A9D4LIV6_DREPO|nr:hypothetical protein DPMN_102322 [Dreissena polymorpha]
MNYHHSTPVVGKRYDIRDLSTSSIEDGKKRNKLLDSDIIKNSEVLTHVHESEADIETITNRMHELF